MCTPELVEDSTTESNKSEDLQIQPEVDDVVDLRNDDMEIIPTPTAIKPGTELEKLICLVAFIWKVTKHKKQL